MRRLKNRALNLLCWTSIDVYIGYKEEARHLPKTLTLKLGIYTRENIKNKTLHFNIDDRQQ